MQFTLGMPFLGVLGKFYRNHKGLNEKNINVRNIDLNVALYPGAFQMFSEFGLEFVICSLKTLTTIVFIPH